MNFTYNLGKSVIVERFIRTLKGKIYRQIATNASNSYRANLDELDESYDKNENHSFNKKLINGDCFALTEKLESHNNKLLK